MHALTPLTEVTGSQAGGSALLQRGLYGEKAQPARRPLSHRRALAVVRVVNVRSPHCGMLVWGAAQERALGRLPPTVLSSPGGRQSL